MRRICVGSLPDTFWKMIEAFPQAGSWRTQLTSRALLTVSVAPYTLLAQVGSRCSSSRPLPSRLLTPDHSPSSDARRAHKCSSSNPHFHKGDIKNGRKTARPQRHREDRARTTRTLEALGHQAFEALGAD